MTIALSKDCSVYKYLTALPWKATAGTALMHSGSSFISLTPALPLLPGSTLGFSFRTCHPAGLVRQFGDIHNSVQLELTQVIPSLLSLYFQSI